jgi:hypothetical protein
MLIHVVPTQQAHLLTSLLWAQRNIRPQLVDILHTESLLRSCMSGGSMSESDTVAATAASALLTTCSGIDMPSQLTHCDQHEQGDTVTA